MSTSESADDYSGLVARLNQDRRVIDCRHRMQWILEHRGPPKTSGRDDWRGRSYCQTSEALIRCTREHAGEIEPGACAILAALPARIDVATSPHPDASLTPEARAMKSTALTVVQAADGTWMVKRRGKVIAEGLSNERAWAIWDHQDRESTRVEEPRPRSSIAPGPW